MLLLLVYKLSCLCQVIFQTDGKYPPQFVHVSNKAQETEQYGGQKVFMRKRERWPRLRAVLLNSFVLLKGWRLILPPVEKQRCAL